MVAGKVDEVSEQPLPNALAAAVPGDVHRVLDGGRVRRPGSVRRERREPDHGAGGVDGHDGRVAARVLLDPVDLLLEAAGNEVERDRRLGDFEVVDRPDRLGVGGLGQAGGEHGKPRKRPGRAGRVSLTGLAPLAQTAEHFHGKEGVYGSIP